MKHRCFAVAIVALSYHAPPALGQSSSLFVANRTKPDPAQQTPVLSPAVASTSFVAVGSPAPRKFSKHDLITIIVRETVTNNAESKLKTEKSFTKEAKISEFPRFTLKDLIDLQINQSNLDGREPHVLLKADEEWEGKGTHRQRNSFTARITSRIIDIKPNGTLVLEARKTIETDGDTLRMIVTGTCRREDITANNTVLSTLLADLTVIKEHTGELRKASKKGWFTKLFEAIFNF